MKRVVVIGAGISGLTAGWDLQRAGADVQVLEASSRPGGVIGTREHKGYKFEIGPNTLQGDSPAIKGLLQDLDMTGEILESDSCAVRRHLYYHGSLKTLPLTMAEFRRSRLFTLPQKLRILLEPYIRTNLDGPEMNVAEFFGRRLGRGVTMTWIDVVVSGIYAGSPNRLGIESAFPALVEMVREHGSILRGMQAKSRARAKREQETADAPPGLFTLKEGLETLPKRLASDLGDRLRYECTVKELRRRPGGGVTVGIENKSGDMESLEADAAVLAIDAAHAGFLLTPLAPEAADLLFEIETSPLVVALAGLKKSELPGLPKGFGYLVPRCTRVRTLGWIFASDIFPGRADEDRIAMNGFVGGVLDPHAIEVNEQILEHLMMSELALALAQRKLPHPEVFEVLRWPGVLPQYNVGHIKRIKAAKQFVQMNAPEVYLAGNWVDGISVEACVARARKVAAQLRESETSAVG